MSDKYFIDTNIFIYYFDTRDPDKKTRAVILIADALKTGLGIISWQVEQEFLNAASKKLKPPLTPADEGKFLQKVMSPLCKIYPNLNLFQNALHIMETYQLSFYDSLIFASAVKGGCSILYSEDFQAGQVINGVKVVNPFA
jgi:predicted nucleic acid-binding protein